LVRLATNVQAFCLHPYFTRTRLKKGTKHENEVSCCLEQNAGQGAKLTDG